MNARATFRNDATAAFDAQVQELSDPPPESLSLAATLQLLDPLEASSDDESYNMVYLMTPSYLQNWLFWAFHQNVKKGESNRLVEALKLAAQRYGLTPPQDATPQQLEDYADPGPIDATFLSLEGDGNDLLLGPRVAVKEGGLDLGRKYNHSTLDQEFPELLRRVKSDSDFHKTTNTSTNNNNNADWSGSGIRIHPRDSMDVDGDKILCCAVPSRFYEVSDCLV